MSTGLQVSNDGSIIEVEQIPAYNLQESFNRQSQVIQRLAAAIYTCDSNGFIKSYNKAAADLWGREPEIGKDLWCGSWKIFEPDGITPLPLDSCPMAIALKEGRAVRGREIIVERPDGVRRNIMSHPDLIFNSSGKIVEAVNMLVDITDLKQKENALQKSEEKYRRIAGELEAALKIEEEFMSIASHELKTPITSIKLFIHLLQELTGADPDKQKKHILNRVQIQVDTLIRLIQELLDATKLKSGQLDLHFEEISLNELVKDLVHDNSLTSTSHIFTIHESGNIHITCDRNRIEQVINNLLTNAVKYSRAGSAVDITITENRENVQVTIRDEGTGIPNEFICRIFDRFFRAHIENKGLLSSIGLGLYISKDIITRHNGNLWVESVIDKGSTFHFTLPKK